MGVTHIEEEGEPLAYIEVIRGRDAGNERTGVASQV
jgi:hypothetical protein